MLLVKTNILFILICLSGLTVRLYKINIPLLEFEPSRQIQTAEITRNLARAGFNVFNPAITYNGSGYTPYLLEFPLYNFVIAILYQIFGVNEIIGRAFSLLGWVISTFFLYQISKKTIGEKFSVITILFYSLSPMSVLVSRSFQPDQWMITLSLGAIYSALSWFETRNLFFLLLSSLLAACASLVKIPSIIFTVIPILFLITMQKSRRLMFSLLFVIISVLPSIIWYEYAYFVSRINNLASSGGFSLSNWFWPRLFIDYKYYSTVFGWNYNYVILPFGLILFTVGLFTAYKNGYFIYSWLLGVFLYFLIFNRHTMVHEYYNLPLLPVAAIFMSMGFLTFLDIFKNNLLAWLYASFMFLLGSLPQISSKSYQPIDRFKYVTTTAEYVRNLTKPNDLIVGSMDSGPTVVYYSDRHGWGFDISGDNNPPVSGKTLNPIEYLEYLRSGGAKLFASAYKAQFLDNKDFSKYMYKKYKVLEENENFVIFSLTKTN